MSMGNHQSRQAGTMPGLNHRIRGTMPAARDCLEHIVRPLCVLGSMEWIASRAIERPLFFDTHVSDKATTLDAFRDGVAPEKDLVSEINIEGTQYHVLAGASAALIKRFQIIVLKVHHLRALQTPFSFQRIEAFFDRLLLTHMVVHMHGRR